MFLLPGYHILPTVDVDVSVDRVSHITYCRPMFLLPGYHHQAGCERPQGTESVQEEAHHERTNPREGMLVCN